MRETTEQWRDEGSGPGHMQTVFVTARMRADVAYRKFLAHSQNCTGSCRSGVNCETATELQRAWRDAKSEARS